MSYIEIINRIVNIMDLTRPSMEMFLSDGNHTYWELEVECSVLLSLAYGFSINEELINKINFIPNNKGISYINNAIKYLKRRGYSTTQIVGLGETFERIYERRVKLLIVVCNKYPDICFKTRHHFNEEYDPMFNGDFMIVINTPEGPVSYHIKLKYFEMFKIRELEHGPEYDGYSVKQGLFRLMSINKELEMKKN